MSDMCQESNIITKPAIWIDGFYCNLYQPIYSKLGDGLLLGHHFVLIFWPWMGQQFLVSINTYIHIEWASARVPPTPPSQRFKGFKVFKGLEGFKGLAGWWP